MFFLGKKPRIFFPTNADRNMMLGSHLKLSRATTKLTFPHKPGSFHIPHPSGWQHWETVSHPKKGFLSSFGSHPVASWPPRLVDSTFGHGGSEGGTPEVCKHKASTFPHLCALSGSQVALSGAHPVTGAGGLRLPVPSVFGTALALGRIWRIVLSSGGSQFR